MNDPAIRVEELLKRYGDLTAVDGISFAVPVGDIFGFLGPNGAGKTTTISMLATLMQPTRGRAWVAGYDVVKQAAAVRRQIGIVFQDSTLDTKLTTAENLDFHARIYGVDDRKNRVRRMLEACELSDWADKLADRLSGGMRRRLEVARALLHEPRVLFLDEPTLGLDVQNRRRIWSDLIERAAESGTTVFVTTHQLEDAELCHRVGILDTGRLVACDTPQALKAELGGSRVYLHSRRSDELARAIRRLDGLEPEVDGDEVTVVVDHPGEFLGELLKRVDLPVSDISVREPRLEDVFLSLTGHSLRDSEVPRDGAWRTVHRAAARRQKRS